MKRLLMVVIASLCHFSFGFNAIVNCASGTLGTTYSTSTPSLQTSLTGIYLRATPTLMVANPSAVRICANVVTVSSSVPPTAANGNEHCIPAGSIAFWDAINIQRGPSNIYLRADVASCTTGIIDVDIW